jgi:hydrogenase-4 component B
VSDPILLFLTVDAVALLLTGACATVMPFAACGLLTTTLCGLGTLLCLPSLLVRMPATALVIPAGPPGLSLHLALDPLSALFLIIVFLAGTCIAGFQANAASPTLTASIRTTAFCLAGTVVALLAADGVALALGLTVLCAAIQQNRSSPVPLVPILLLAAVCLLTPSGYAPRFDTIRAAPLDLDRATAAAALTVAAVTALVWPPALVWPQTGDRDWIRDALTAGVLIPSGSYLLLRLVVDLSAAAAQAWWGFVILLAGGGAAILQAWRSAAVPEIDTAIAALMQRQAGIATITIGLALIARSADLPDAASFALEATCLTAIGAGVAGTLATLAAHTIGTSAGTYRLSRLGGLIHTMPGTSAALSAGLLALCALPPSLGFATMWLSFQSILSAPRTGGLLSQLPLALGAAAIALSAALTTAASLRIVGIAILGRPRTPRGAGARETKSPVRTILLSLAGIALAIGVVPRLVLWLLANPAIRDLTGLPAGTRSSMALISISGLPPGYLALPVLALLGLATGAVMLAPFRSHKEAKTAVPWTDGMQPLVGLPFGEPAAQSAGAGFLPALPVIPLLRPRRPPALPKPRLPPASTGIWLILAGFAALLLALAIAG